MAYNVTKTVTHMPPFICTSSPPDFKEITHKSKVNTYKSVSKVKTEIWNPESCLQMTEVIITKNETLSEVYIVKMSGASNNIEEQCITAK